MKSIVFHNFVLRALQESSGSVYFVWVLCFRIHFFSLKKKKIIFITFRSVHFAGGKPSRTATAIRYIRCSWMDGMYNNLPTLAQWTRESSERKTSDVSVLLTRCDWIKRDKRQIIIKPRCSNVGRFQWQPFGPFSQTKIFSFFCFFYIPFAFLFFFFSRSSAGQWFCLLGNTRWLAI